MNRIYITVILINMILFSSLAYGESDVFNETEVLNGNIILTDTYEFDVYNNKSLFITMHIQPYKDEFRKLDIYVLSLYLKDGKEYKLLNTWRTGVGDYRFEAQIKFTYKDDIYLRISRYVPGTGNFDASIIYFVNKSNELERVKQANMSFIGAELNEYEKPYHRGGDYNTFEDNNLTFKIYFNYKGIRCIGKFIGSYKIVVGTNGQKKIVVEDYKKIIAGVNANAFYLNANGDEFYRQGEYEKAIDMYKEAIKIENKYAQAYSNLGLVYMRNNKFNEAIEVSKKAIDFSDDNFIIASSYFNLARTYEKMKKYNEALEFFKKALSFRRHDAYTDGITRMQNNIEN